MIKVIHAMLLCFLSLAILKNQLRLLETIPGAYMWCAPIPDRCLARWSLVQKPSNINQTVYHDALVYQLQYDMTQIERGFVEFVQQRYQK